MGGETHLTHSSAKTTRGPARPGPAPNGLIRDSGPTPTGPIDPAAMPAASFALIKELHTLLGQNFSLKECKDALNSSNLDLDQAKRVLLHKDTNVNQSKDIDAQRDPANLAETDKAPPRKAAAQQAVDCNGARDKTASGKAAADKAAADTAAPRKAVAGETASDKAAAEAAARDKAEAQKAVAEKAKAAADKAATDKAAAEKTAIDKAVTEKAAADITAFQRAHVDTAAADKAAAEKAATEKVVDEKAAADQTTSEKASVDKAAADKAAVDKLAVNESSAHQLTGAEAANDRPASENSTLNSANAAPYWKAEAAVCIGSEAGTEADAAADEAWIKQMIEEAEMQRKADDAATRAKVDAATRETDEAEVLEAVRLAEIGTLEQPNKVNLKEDADAQVANVISGVREAATEREMAELNLAIAQSLANSGGDKAQFDHRAANKEDTVNFLEHGGILSPVEDTVTWSADEFAPLDEIFSDEIISAASAASILAACDMPYESGCELDCLAKARAASEASLRAWLNSEQVSRVPGGASTTMKPPQALVSECMALGVPTSLRWTLWRHLLGLDEMGDLESESSKVDVLLSQPLVGARELVDDCRSATKVFGDQLLPLSAGTLVVENVHFVTSLLLKSLGLPYSPDLALTPLVTSLSLVGLLEVVQNARTGIEITAGDIRRLRSDTFNALCSLLGRCWPGLMAGRPWGATLTGHPASSAPNRSLLDWFCATLTFRDPQLGRRLGTADGAPLHLTRSLCSLLGLHASPRAFVCLLELSLLSPAPYKVTAPQLLVELIIRNRERLLATPPARAAVAIAGLRIENVYEALTLHAAASDSIRSLPRGLNEPLIMAWASQQGPPPAAPFIAAWLEANELLSPESKMWVIDLRPDREFEKSHFALTTHVPPRVALDPALLGDVMRTIAPVCAEASFGLCFVTSGDPQNARGDCPLTALRKTIEEFINAGFARVCLLRGGFASLSEAEQSCLVFGESPKEAATGVYAAASRMLSSTTAFKHRFKGLRWKN